VYCPPTLNHFNCAIFWLLLTGFNNLIVASRNQRHYKNKNGRVFIGDAEYMFQLEALAGAEELLCIKHTYNSREWVIIRLRKLNAERRFRLVGHTLRLPSHQPSKVAMSWTPDDGRRRRGRPEKTCHRTFQEDQTRANITWEEAEHTAMDRPLWRQAAAHCAYWHGRN